MKVYLLLTASLLGVCNCDKLKSSYALLPYENEIIPNQPSPQTGYQQPVYNDAFGEYYNYAGNNDKKRKYTFDRIMRAPFKALKGARNYMIGMFDDMRTRFLELNGGSFLPRSKGDLLNSGSENIVRQTYQVPSTPSTNIYNAHTYYNPYLPSVQKYSEPAKDYSYQDAEIRTGDNSIAELSLTDDEFREIGNSIDDGYKTQDDFGLQNQIFQNKRGVELSLSDDIPRRRENTFKNFSPSPPDITNPGGISYTNSRDFSIPNSVPLNIPYSVPALPKRREIVQQRNRQSLTETQRTQRSYHEDTSNYDYVRPIPVPVPIAVSPARLVFPSIQNMHPIVGY